MNTNNTFFLAISFLFLSLTGLNAQFNLYEDQFNGGVTGNGFSIAYNDSLDSTDIDLHIPVGSTIRKAYLMAVRHGNATNTVVTLNGVDYDFDNNNIASPIYNDPIYGGASAVHATEITNDITAADTLISISLSSQPVPNNPNYLGEDRYRSFYVYVAYQNNALPEVNAVVFLNDQDIAVTNTFQYNVTTTFPNATQIGVSNLYSNVCVSADGHRVSFEGDVVGTVYGQDPGSGFCGGPLGSFYYENDSLFGLENDVPNTSVNEADAIFEASSLVTGPVNSVEMSFTAIRGVADNTMWATFLTYGAQNIATGIHANVNKSTTKVFPNPTSDQLFIQLDPSYTYSTLTINNAIGQRVKRIDLAEEKQKKVEINLKNMPKGVYYIKLQEESKGIELLKVVKD